MTSSAEADEQRRWPIQSRSRERRTSAADRWAAIATATSSGRNDVESNRRASVMASVTVTAHSATSARTRARPSIRGAAVGSTVAVLTFVAAPVGSRRRPICDRTAEIPPGADAPRPTGR